MNYQRISLPAIFRDRWFSEKFSSVVQAPIRSEPLTLEIDFSACEWIDPLPMLALLCEVRQWAQHPLPSTRQSLLVVLGTSGVGVGGPARKARVRRFLAKHGFLQSFVEADSNVRFTFDSDLPNFPDEFAGDELSTLLRAIDLSHNKEGDLYYHPDPACRPRFAPCPLRSEELGVSVRRFVDEVVQSMDDSLFRARVSQFAYRDSALQRLRQVATEVISNAIEHALLTPTEN